MNGINDVSIQIPEFFWNKAHFEENAHMNEKAYAVADQTIMQDNPQPFL